MPMVIFLVTPGVVHAFRKVSEGLEKPTGTERLDGQYERKTAPRKDGTIFPV